MPATDSLSIKCSVTIVTADSLKYQFQWFYLLRIFRMISSVEVDSSFHQLGSLGSVSFADVTVWLYFRVTASTSIQWQSLIAIAVLVFHFHHLGGGCHFVFITMAMSSSEFIVILYALIGIVSSKTIKHSRSIKQKNSIWGGEPCPIGAEAFSC